MLHEDGALVLLYIVWNEAVFTLFIGISIAILTYTLGRIYSDNCLTMLISLAGC